MAAAQELKKLYMDEEAVFPQAGAMYTDEMILRREQLRSDESVNAALQTAWIA